MRHRRIATHFRHRPYEPDPYFSNVVLLMPGEGKDGLTTPPDKSHSAKTLTAAGTGSPSPQILTRRSRWSYGSWWTGGNLDNRLTTPDSADFSFGTGDFDIRMDLSLASSLNDLEILAQRAGADGNNFWLIRKTSSQKIRVFAKTAGVNVTDLTTTDSFPTDTNTFTTLHVRRRAGSVSIAFNGVVQAASSLDGAGAWPDAPADLIIGNGDDSYANGIIGYYSYLRITKGVSREFGADWRLRMRQPLPLY